MAQSTVVRRKSKALKPAKPRPDFPLFPHATGRWAKKIKGTFHYFGPWDDPQGSLDKYLAGKEWLHAGRKPPENTGGATVADTCNKFLNHKKQLLECGELSPRTWQDYHAVCDEIILTFGKVRCADDLNADDFRKLRKRFSKRLGPIALGNRIQRVRSVFKFAYDEGLIEKPVRYGQGFSKPSRKKLRVQRSSNRAENGRRMFDASEMRQVLDWAGVQLKAMVLLGINCGMGNTDVSELPLSALDLEGGWLDYARVKTGIERRCPLWPETVKALRIAIEARPMPRNAKDGKLVFLTRCGRRWIKLNRNNTPDDSIGKEFAKLLKLLNIKRKGVSFYALRHTFQTVAEESQDFVSVKSIMGHLDHSMSAHYREGISDARLMAVSNTVHAWLFPIVEETKEGGSNE